MNTTVNDASYWRAFENNSITHSAAHYLMAIDTLRDELGYARSTDVADRLDVSRGAASIAIAQLKKRGWVEEDPNRFLLLTNKGHRMAHRVEHNFRVLAKLFEDVLGVSQGAALADACKMEHLMSSETGRGLVWLMRYILGDETRAAAVRSAMACFRRGCESDDSSSLFEGKVEGCAPPEHHPNGPASSRGKGRAVDTNASTAVRNKLGRRARRK